MDSEKKRVIEQYIQRDPYRPTPDEAIVMPSAVKVWAVIGDLRSQDGDVASVAWGYDLPEEAVRAAMAYYERYRALIDNRLEKNSAPVDRLNSASAG